MIPQRRPGNASARVSLAQWTLGNLPPSPDVAVWSMNPLSPCQHLASGAGERRGAALTTYSNSCSPLSIKVKWRTWVQPGEGGGGDSTEGFPRDSVLQTGHGLKFPDKITFSALLPYLKLNTS